MALLRIFLFLINGYPMIANHKNEMDYNPPNGYHGAIFLPLGPMKQMGTTGGTNILLKRSSITGHEMKENWFGTNKKMPYSKPGINVKDIFPSPSWLKGMEGAHNEAVKWEGFFFGNCQPGIYDFNAGNK